MDPHKHGFDQSEPQHDCHLRVGIVSVICVHPCPSVVKISDLYLNHECTPRDTNGNSRRSSRSRSTTRFEFMCIRGSTGRPRIQRSSDPLLHLCSSVPISG